jgi:hypothetical protein
MKNVDLKNETPTFGNVLLDAVICPNLCFNGMVKTYEYERALYDLVKCPYCKGKGKVSQNEANRIDALL